MTTLFVNILDPIDLFPHLINYYKDMGVDRVVAVVTFGAGNKHWKTLAQTDWGTPVIMAYGHNELGASENDAKAVNAIRKNFDGWHVIADLDEFHCYGAPLEGIIEDLEFNGAVGALSQMVDRIAKPITPEHGGLYAPLLPVPPFNASTPGLLGNTFDYACNLTEVIGANANKIGLVKAGIDVTSGHHSASGGLFLSRGYATHHFKWTSTVEEHFAEHYRLHRAKGSSWLNELELLDKRLRRTGWLDVSGLTVKPANEI